MAYAKKTWVAPLGTFLTKFIKANETASSVELTWDPALTNSPTAFDVYSMNNIEQGIETNDKSVRTLNTIPKATGTATALVIATAGGNFALTNGNNFQFRVGTDGTINTINVDGTGVKSLRDKDGDQIVAKEDDIIVAIYDTTLGFFLGASRGGIYLTGNAIASDLLAGKTMYTTDPKAQVTGTALALGATTYTPSTSNQTIASGTHLTGTQTILGDADLVASKILETANIFGVQGTVVEKGYATGTAVVTGDAFGAEITVTGLTFQPSVITIKSSNPDDGIAGCNVNASMSYRGNETGTDVMQIYPDTTSIVTINSTGFIFDLFTSWVGRTMTWYCDK